MELTRWTRTQRLQTAAGIPIEAVIIDRAELPVYLRIAETVTHPSCTRGCPFA
jgi:hypothetical protein